MRAAGIGLMTVGLLAGRALAQEAPIAIESPARGCPGRGEVAAELEARLPGITRARPDVEPRVRYRLEIGPPGGRAGVTLRLTEASGTVVLARQLSPPGSPVARAPGERCRALAEAAALVVVRYLREIGARSPIAALPPDEPPPPPPPAPQPPPPAPSSPPAAAPAPPPAAVAAPPPAPPPTPVEIARPVVPSTPAPADGSKPAAAAVRAASAPSSPGTPTGPRARAASAGFLGAAAGIRSGLSPGGEGTGLAPFRSEVLLGLRASRGWLAGEIGAGIATQQTTTVPGSAGDARLDLRAFPLRAALGVELPAPGGALVPLAGIDLDLLRFRASGLADARQGWRLEPIAELGLAYRAAGRRLFVRGALWAGFSLAPRDFDAGGAGPVFRTPQSTFRVELETGVVLWKNSGSSIP